MNIKYITDRIKVDLDESEMVATNGQTGDDKREIWIDKSTGAVWIETNGNPEVYETEQDALAALG